MKRTQQLLWLGFIISVLIISSCAPVAPAEEVEEPPVQQEVDVEEPTEATIEEEKVTITVWHGDADNVAKITEDLIKTEFNKLYPNIEVKYELAPEPFKEKLLVSTPAGTGPDLFEWNHDWIGTFVEAGLLEPIGDLVTQDLQDKYFASAFGAGNFQGKLYTLPISAEAGALAYNKTLLGDIVLPKDTEELKSIMAQFVDQGLYGISYPFAPFLVSGYIHAFGGYLWDDEKGLGVNSAENQAAMEWVINTYKPYMSEDPTWDPQSVLFNEAKAPFAVNGPWMVGGWTEAGIEFGIMPLPLIDELNKMPEPYIGVKSIYMTTQVSNKEAAFKFMEWATTSKERILQRATKLGYIPVLKEVMELDEIKNNPVINGFAEQVSYGKPMSSMAEMVAVWGPFDSALGSMFTGAKSVKQALDDAHAEIEEAIAELEK